jgi:hypothetical protein
VGAVTRDPLVKTETLPEDLKSIPMADLIPLLGESSIDPETYPSSPGSKRFFEYTQLEGESQLDFDLRRVQDILISYYKIPNTLGPIQITPEFTVPGFSLALTPSSLNKVSITLTVDSPRALEVPEGCTGFRLALMCEMEPMLGRVMIPDFERELKDFYKVLPSVCSFAPWQKSPRSKPPVYFFESLLVAPSHLTCHFVADSVSRFLEWAKADHSYS